MEDDVAFSVKFEFVRYVLLVFISTFIPLYYTLTSIPLCLYSPAFSIQNLTKLCAVFLFFLAFLAQMSLHRNRIGGLENWSSCSVVYSQNSGQFGPVIQSLMHLLNCKVHDPSWLSNLMETSLFSFQLVFRFLPSFNCGAKKFPQ